MLGLCTNIIQGHAFLGSDPVRSLGATKSITVTFGAQYNNLIVGDIAGLDVLCVGDIDLCIPWGMWSLSRCLFPASPNAKIVMRLSNMTMSMNI
jgi:hypothetical protein